MIRISDKRIFTLVCLNIAIYVFILILDFMKASGGVSEEQGFACDLLKYSAIISCLLICIFALSHERKNVALIQLIVFCFTLGADFFLLFTDLFATGVLVFLGAHACALYRYKPKWLLPVGISSAAIFITVFLVSQVILRGNIDLALVFAVCPAYAVLIINVAISTFRAKQPHQNELLSRIGMLLFIACDINVLLFNALPEGNGFYTASIVLMWLFYLPAQTLLALSATTLPLIKRESGKIVSSSNA